MNGNAEKLARSLAAIVGAENAGGDVGATEECAIRGARPKAVVRPANAEEIAEILKFCASEKLGVVACGAGTKVEMGGAPTRYDVALVTKRLQKVHGYDPGDLTLSVEAGAGMAEVSQLLAGHGQFLPLSVPYQKRATIGGTVASGVDSALRQGYGSVRDFLLGAEFVTGDGRYAKSGGRVVKNVAGYDLHKLFIGSMGTLGILTRLNFKTFPVAEENRSFVASFTKESGGLDFARRILQSPVAPATLEILSPTMASLCGGHRSPNEREMPPVDSWFPPFGWLVIAGMGGTRRVLQRFEAELGRMADESGATETAALDHGRRAAAEERMREAIPLLLDASSEATIIRVSVLPSRMGEIFVASRESSEKQGIPVAILARGVGTVYVGFLPETGGEKILERLAAAAIEVLKAAEVAQGFGWIPWCPADLKGQAPIWGKDRPDVALMRKVKQVLDPGGILSRGRFIGGI